ncbi:MAG: agmatine deiminase family protein [Deltaproteobacteria bacterium]|nr:agmatine deiminase family protein [Deltaproteobacteria bacterium]MCW9050149.1 agmatine deiminase family protein [Deltaproteobacteria bacterium]
MLNQTATRRLPAEWEPQDAILLAWPHNETDWAPIIEQAEQIYVEMISQITRFEAVIIAAPEVDPVRLRLAAEGIDLSRVSLLSIETNDTWTRDYGPVTVLDSGKPLLLNFNFNGWGEKFPANKDNLVNAKIQASGVLAVKQQHIDLVMEGGSIEADGQGTLLTTSHCLLHPNRNPQLDRYQLEDLLASLCGISHCLWLDHGWLAGDDTDSHIDTLARLCPDDTIVYVRCDLPEDEHYPELRKMAEQLANFKTSTGQPFRLLPLPWPQACYEGTERLPATYANFLVINKAVLVPTYQDPADAVAIETIGKAFPGREVIGIDCRALIQQHGSLHCISMQLPHGVLA